jgi:hypothetical protein
MIKGWLRVARNTIHDYHILNELIFLWKDILKDKGLVMVCNSFTLNTCICKHVYMK